MGFSNLGQNISDSGTAISPSSKSAGKPAGSTISETGFFGPFLTIVFRILLFESLLSSPIFGSISAGAKNAPLVFSKTRTYS